MHSANGGIKADHDGASENDVDTNTNPTTPVKVEQASTTPTSARDE
jgi:hypothetical protein